MAHGDQAAGAVAGLLQLLVAQVPHLVGCLGAQHAMIVKEALELQVSPVIQGVADGFSHDLCPLAELFIVRGIAGDIMLLHTGAAHQAPLVVIGAQPHLGDVFIAHIGVNLLGAEVAVVVDDRALGRVIMIKHPGRLGREQEILIHESLHCKTLLACI